MFNPFKKAEDKVNQELFQKIVGSVLRQGLTALGTYLVMHGVDAGGSTELMSGAATVLTSLAWSAYNHYVVHKA